MFRNHPINAKLDYDLIYPSNCDAVCDILKSDIFTDKNVVPRLNSNSNKTHHKQRNDINLETTF